jgi:hypothetical protein
MGIKDTLFHCKAYDMYGRQVAEAFFVERYGDVAFQRFVKRFGPAVKNCTIFTGKLYDSMVIKLAPLGLLEV